MKQTDFIIFNGVLKHYKGAGGNVVIPDGIIGIHRFAFSCRNDLKSIIIPYGVRSIDSYAFEFCSNLESITIPESVTDIGVCAFYKCYKLVNIEIPNGLKRIAGNTFHRCRNLQSITIPRTVREIGFGAFAGCLVKQIHYTGKMPILNHFSLSVDLCHWVFRNPSNFHTDDIQYCWGYIKRSLHEFVKDITYTELLLIEEKGLITKENGYELLEIIRENGNVECTVELINYLSENQIFGNYMDRFTLDLE